MNAREISVIAGNCIYSVQPDVMCCRSITAQSEKAGISPGLDAQEQARLASPLPRDDVVFDLVERRLRNDLLRDELILSRIRAARNDFVREGIADAR